MEFSKRHDCMYMVARQGSAAEQIEQLSSQLARHFDDRVLALNPFRSWDALFSFIEQRCQGIPVIIDEFPYLVQSTKALPSILQEYWDGRFSKQDIFTILCGSSVSMMESLLGHGSPIYGRRTGQVLLEPLGFFDARRFHPSLPVRGQVEFHAVLGGTPAYLLEFDEQASLMENIKERILAKHSFMAQDVEFVLREELDEPRYYFSILHSIAKGNTTMGTIVNDTGLDKGVVSKYTSVLVDMHLVERRVPVTEPHPARSRKGIYMLKDNYFKFWFRYVFANPQYIEQGLHDALVEEKIAPDLDAFVGKAFEDVCIEWMRATHPRHLIGRWWDRTEEIDIVGMNKAADHAFLAEVKWSTLGRQDVARILSNLERKAPLVDTGCSTVERVVIARTIHDKARLASPGVTLLDLDDMGRTAP